MRYRSIIILTLTTLFFLLTMYHLKFRQTFLVKVGMTDFFPPFLVGVLSFAMPILTAINGLFLLLRSEKKSSIYFALATFSFYTLYNLFLYIKTGDDCGCSNFFIDIELHKQLIIGMTAILFCGLVLPRKQQVQLTPKKSLNT
ncbi:hypothetical protein QF042_003793 [Pedobacter sp. W3I1]|uniref:MauE/DoxX family redox-associated membrane protein n=1 Tax=Pedobacter sp. W3I1 TaxID=3042291 RepID=UPI002785F537|nr:hypothetical protein [Pedobacter sp. W3I1]